VINHQCSTKAFPERVRGGTEVYSNDHRPIHVHVRKGGAEAVFNVEQEVELREAVGFSVRELRRPKTWQSRIVTL